MRTASITIRQVGKHSVASSSSASASSGLCSLSANGILRRRWYSVYKKPTVPSRFPTPTLLPPLSDFDSFAAAVGNTSLIRLRGPSEATGCEILGKCEWENPGGSIKDRAAVWMIKEAEEQGILVPGGQCSIFSFTYHDQFLTSSLTHAYCMFFLLHIQSQD
jgi:hypothetical protein